MTGHNYIFLHSKIKMHSRRDYTLSTVVTINLPIQVGTFPIHTPFGLEPSPPQVSISVVLSPKLMLQEYLAVVPN